MDDVTVLRIRTPPPDEVIDERIQRRRKSKEQLCDIIIAGLVALHLLMIAIWARTNPQRS